MATPFKLSFFGAAGGVTGSNFMLESPRVKVLVDCGFEQGCKTCENTNHEPFPFDAKAVDVLLVTHAHVDHIGRIPLLVKRGFSGTIYSTEATRELAEPMLRDSLMLLSKEALRENREPLYGESDVKVIWKLWKTIPYHTETSLPGDLTFVFKNAGHILGSAMVEITHEPGGKAGGTIVFTGDLGNTHTSLLPPTESITDASYVVMESVYGDRVHEAVSDRKQRLRDIVRETIKQKGVLLIPAFTLERTQVILYELNNLVEEGEVPVIPVFLDSPLAIAVTDIYRHHRGDFGESVRKEIMTGDDIFAFPKLSFTETKGESQAINKVSPPKIIIAGAGMSHGGRILHHEKHYLSDSKTTVLLVGYQVPGSVGRLLQDGAPHVTIMDEKVPVRARIETITGYSAHRDMNGLMEFAEGFAKRVKQVFVVMGEPKASLFLVQRLRDYLNLNAVAPKKGETYTNEL